MDITSLGGTGLEVSVAGLGCGGSSRLGQRTGLSKTESVALVREALDLGINLLDTAAAYGTEEIVGEAISGIGRDRVIVCTKAAMRDGDGLFTADRVVTSLDNSLRLLGTDYVDVFQLHGVPPAAYDHANNVLLPSLLKEKARGKTRFLGVTEVAPKDHGHDMLQRAVSDGSWDTVMLGFNMMHQNARAVLFPETRARGVGTLVMFAVRNVFSRPDHLRAELDRLAAAGEISMELATPEALQGLLVQAGGAHSLTDAAYRFARYEPGVDVVLFGTGSREHLRANVASISGPPLPKADRDSIVELFGHLVGVGLDRPDGWSCRRRARQRSWCPSTRGCGRSSWHTCCKRRPRPSPSRCRSRPG